MNKFFLLLMVIILMSSFAYAQNEESAKPDTQPKTISKTALVPHQVRLPKFISGEVLNIDTSDPTVTIVTIKDIAGQEMIVEVNPNLSITKIISPSELTPGDNIRITYEEKDTQKIARNIFLGRPHPIRSEYISPAAENDSSGPSQEEKPNTEIVNKEN
jgi:hypothetical protein